MKIIVIEITHICKLKHFIMKSGFLLLFFTLVSFTSAISQKWQDRQHMYQLYRVKSDQYHLHNYLEFLQNRKQKMEHKKVITTRKVGNKSYKTSYTFNELGKVTKVEGKDYTHSFSYINDSLISAIDFVSKKGTRRTEIKYVDNKKVLEETFEDGRLLSRIVIQYDDQDRVIFSSIDAKNTYSMAYTYGDKKLSWQRFMKNDKVLKEWDYSCKTEGSLVADKNQESICNYTQESNDGSRIEFSRRAQNGTVYLYKDYFNASSKKVKSEVYRDEKILVSRTEINELTKANETNYYNEKGEILDKSMAKIDDRGNMVEFVKFRIGKEHKAQKTTNKYNEQNELIESAYYFKGKLTSQNVYEYLD
jgi:hypothetical protein